MTRPGNFFVVGVDGGASKTTAVVMDSAGEVLGRGGSGGSNIHTAGVEQTKENLLSAMNAAVEQAGYPLERAAAVTWALAGAGQPADRELLKKLAQEVLSGMELQIETDAVAALMGGIGSRQGVVLIAGTGMMAYGENRGCTARAGGWGYFLDEGSAYGLARQALQALAQSADGIRPSTRLAERILQALDLRRPGDLVGWLYDSGRDPASIAALAPLVLEEAQAGDLAATAIAARGAEALVDALEAVAMHLELSSEPFHLVLSGGLMQDPFYRRLVNQAVGTRLPWAAPRLPKADAATGAGLLALEFLGQPLPALSPDPPSGFKPSAWASEQRNVLTTDLDMHPTPNLVGLMHLLDQQAAAAVGRTLPAIRPTT